MKPKYLILISIAVITACSKKDKPTNNPIDQIAGNYSGMDTNAFDQSTVHYDGTRIAVNQHNAKSTELLLSLKFLTLSFISV